MQNLKRKVEYLSGQENDITYKIRSAERQPWKRPKKEVEVWLTDVQWFKNNVQRLEQEVVGETNVSLHMRLGRDIAKKILEVQELQKRGRDFNNCLMVDEDPTGRLLQPLPEDFVKSTKARNTEKIWECVMNDDVTKIEKGKFDYVYWVTVSKAFDITKLQSDIANALNLGNCLDDKDETKRVSKLHAMLSQQKRYVLILDDVWERFDLDRVGIPNPKRSNGFKLVLTTRSLEVCTTMKCTPVKVDLLTEEEALTLFRNIVVGNDTVLAADVEEIAAKIAEECACLPLAIVTLAGSCRVLKGTREWRNALDELISSTKDASDDVSKVFEILKFSYDRLGNKVLQDCFLYCSLYPEDHKIPVNELIEYWIAEELIVDMDNVEAQFDKGHAILGKLTSSCLLESFTRTEYNIHGSEKILVECVRMHDLIRDMAIRIAAPRFMVKAGERIKPYEHWSQDLERISFMYNLISELPSTPPVCRQLTTLLLNCRNGSMLEVIPDSFFTNMPCLQVLDLSKRRMTSLPKSISNLENLHALILRDCYGLKNVMSVEKLKALKMFVLTKSEIEELPEGIEELVNLRKLDLSHNTRLRTFPSWKLSRLSKLQYLRIDNTKVRVSTEGLLFLHQLKVVAAHFHNVQEVTRYVISQQFQGLQKYRLIVGEDTFKSRRHALFGSDLGKDFTITYDPVPFESIVDQPVLPAGIKFFAVDGFHNTISLSAIPPCFKDLSNCVVRFCCGLESIFSSSTFLEDGQIPLGTVERVTLVGLPKLRVLFDGIAPPHNIYFNLQELKIRDCHALKNIFPVHLLQNFPNLKQLWVVNCNNLEDIIVEKEEMSDRGNHQDYSNSISLLKELNIHNCPALKNIFPIHLWQNFPNLKHLYVGGCENLKDIIVEKEEMSDRGNHQDYSKSISLPKLNYLCLYQLQSLKSIYNGVMVCPSILQVVVGHCYRVRRLPLSLHMDGEQATPPPALLEIIVCKKWWESLKWDDPLTKTILQPFLDLYEDRDPMGDLDDYYPNDPDDDYSEDYDKR
ncbi:hypothetical protein C3L33_11318, partial [Rhododendron williamsianum]